MHTFIKKLNTRTYPNDSETWLEVRRVPSEKIEDSICDMLEIKFESSTEMISSFITNSIDSSVSIYEYLKEEMEDYYNFSFDNPLTSSLPWYNDSCFNATSPYVFIEEETAYDPNYTGLFTGSNIKMLRSLSMFYFLLKWAISRIRLLILSFNWKCKGLIRYDFHDHVHNNEVNSDFKLPVININGTEGRPIESNPDNYRIKFHVEQEWDKNVISYNVIGRINGTDPDNKKTILVTSLYDSMWCQGTADSAIGCGIVMAIAKYMKQLEVDYNISPKYNVKFVLFGGEEVGRKGAKYYADRHKNESIVAFIDLNQLGFKQSKESDPDLKLHVALTKLRNVSIVKQIVKKTNYKTRLPENDETKLQTAYYPNIWGLASNNLAFSKDNTILFLKDTGWTYHHRDGLNHTDGDAMDYYYPEDVNLTAEMILNVTRFYAYDADCSFKYNVDFDFDNTGGNDNYDDSVNVEYTIETDMPNERVMVLAYLQCIDPGKRWIRYSTEGFGVEKREYIIESPSSVINDDFNITLPAFAPKGNYRVKVFLFDSRGQIYEEVYNKWHNGEWRSKSNSDDFDYSEKKYMVPPVQFPNIPSKPSGPTTVDPWEKYTYTTNTTDPNGKDVYYQWAWRYNKTWQDLEPFWIANKNYTSGTNHSKTHKWLVDQQVQVRVRAKNMKYGFTWTNWSEPLNVTVGDGCWFESENYAVADHPFYCYGFETGLEGGVQWEYSFGGKTLKTSQAQNASNNYTNEDIGDQITVNLTVNDSIPQYVYFEKTIDILAIKALFNVSSIGAQSNETLIFNDTSLSYNSIVNWTWNFSDGTILYGANVTHNFSTCGEYNVTLTVRDNASQANTSNFTKKIFVEVTAPEIVWVSQTDEEIRLGSNITIFADPYDNKSGIETVKVNITYPDDSYSNFSMNPLNDTLHAYQYVFNDTLLAGTYEYSIYICDSANNSNYTGGRTFNVTHCFGSNIPGNNTLNVTDSITGSVFKALVNGTADNITAYIQTNLSSPPDVKCMIYRYNDSSLIGTTVELTPNTGDNPQWVVFNFSGTKPSLVNDTEYILACWSNDTCNLSYHNDSGKSILTSSHSYGTPPDPVSQWTTDDENKTCSIYCCYTTKPEITEVSQSSDTMGLGYSVTINSDVNRHGTAIKTMNVNITYPDETSKNLSMENTENSSYEYKFEDTWTVGQYNYTIWSVDAFGGTCNNTDNSFNVSTNATISICTIKDEYVNNETINLTDPPVDNSMIGYELLDDGNVLCVWNKYDNYYFNTSSGIQLTNHYNEYWSHNVLMLGYYNNDMWNLIYRTDELSGFNKDIETDNETYVNVTLWKDLTYQGYDFRLAIRYHLGVNDGELTVIPYIKNLDSQDIPYTLGFGWEMKDIQIDMTESGDYIDVNQTTYYLNQTLDNSYTDLSESEFYLKENITNTCTKSLYLKWNNSLTYKLQVKSRDGQYNAPVTLFVRIGTLNTGQEKYTKMYWYDADQVSYHFNSYDSVTEYWTSNPSYMVDGSTSNYASTSIDGDIELCDGNNCSGSDIGEISKVELRVCAYYSNGQRNILLRPVFGGTTDGLNIRYTPTTSSGVWSPWFDITNDPFAPVTWTWSDVENLDCDIEVESQMGQPFTMYCSKVELRITYTPYTPPGISNPIPTNGSVGVSIAPTLNITVSDAGGDSMDVSWLSNSSGTWQVFGTNNSVNNGTYHQNFSNATENGKWWYWKVNVTDGTNYTESDVYKFYTGCQSKIENTGSYHFKGYMMINIDYYNESSEEWEIVFDVIDDLSPTTVLWEDPGGSPDQNILALDGIFNGLMNTSYITNYTDYDNGPYRIYVALIDPYGNVLVCDDETELEATYEFEITFE
jgi:hypothetical protein